jgi:hypothetical protein
VSGVDPLFHSANNSSNKCLSPEMIFVAYPQLHMHRHMHTHIYTKWRKKNVVSGYTANMANINNHPLHKFLRKCCTGILQKSLRTTKS